MKPYLKAALKNIKSNRSRTIVTVLLSAVATTVLVFSTALMDGEHKALLKSAVELYPGYIQITHEGFKDTPSMDNIIGDSSRVIEAIEKNKAVKEFSVRFETFVLFSSDEKSLGGMLCGIEPEKEKHLSRLENSLLKGSYLEKEEGNSVYMGSELAKSLKVDIGDRLSFIGTGADYSFTADNLTVKGVFQTGLFDFDSSSAFVSKSYFDTMFASENKSTHIIVLPAVKEDAFKLSGEINKTLPQKTISQSWNESMESLVKAMELDSVFGYITLGVFFIVIFFVILIYTFISIYARVKEIGVLRAIGTSRSQVFGMLLFESSVLSFAGVLIGGMAGAYLAYYFNINPLDFGKEFDEQFKQYGLVNTELPTDFNILNIIRDMAIIYMLCILSTLYPILKINSFKPVEAMNHV